MTDPAAFWSGAALGAAATFAAMARLGLRMYATKNVRATK